MQLLQRSIVLFFSLSILWLIQGTSIYAQEAKCAAIARSALEQVNAVCEATGRNQVCNGNALVDIIPREDIEYLVFENPGDIVEFATIESIQLSSMDVEKEIWGMVLMRLQANLPNTAPGQGVTFLMFGNVQMANDTPIDSIEQNESQDNLQAFYFHTGIGDAPCKEAPNSGILVSTSEGMGEVSFLVNGVNISLSSMAFLQAQPNGEMIFNLLQGRAFLDVFGVKRRLLPGTRVRIPIDENLKAKGPPSEIEMCEGSDLTGLPFDGVNCKDVIVVLDPEYHCGGDLVLPVGMTIHLHLGSGYMTQAETRTAMNAHNTSISINGVSVPITLNGPYIVTNPIVSYAFGTNYEWGTPAVGEYSIVGIEPHATRTCHIIIVEPTE